ncbi:MAG TPA: alginate export family protein [Acidobacteriaceae bacterium]|nr:alginate export family protein [Acidobacteriaceae bacterium]
MQKIIAALLVCAASALPAITQTAPAPAHPVRFNLIYRARAEGWQWFAAPPASNTYAYVDSLLRLSLSQSVQYWDWKLELSQPAILDAPSSAVAPGAQGQLGLGATYYAANGNNAYPAAAFLKQAFLRYHLGGPHSDKNIRIGRFEFFGGMETHPHNPTLLWLQTRRIQQRLLGNFGFTNAQRSFDGVDAHYGSGSWDITAMAARADQGVFNMNGNPELNVDAQYLAFTQNAAHGHLLWRAFAIGYHDGRTGLTKTDNRPLPVRQADHHNIRLGTYGGNLIAEAPAGPGQLDFLFWGAYQNGSWGTQSDSANAAAVEAGYHLTRVRTAPWLRTGWFRSSGDNNPSDNKHTTFFQLLPTPRGYARLPFFNLMNNTDEFVSAIDKPAKKLALRSDLHWLQLTSSKDLWYLGGGALDNKVFGFVGRPSNASTSLGTLADISADWAASRSLSVGLYYGYAWGKTVVAAIYPTGRNAQFAYAEMDYHWGAPLSK